MVPQAQSGRPAIGTQVTAVFTGSFLTGAMICLSGVVIPVFLDTDTSSTHLLRQWVRLYHYGHIYMPALCVATCSLYGYTALNRKASNRKEWAIYCVAGMTTLAMVPFTWAVMAPTNNILFGLEASATGSNPTSEAGLSVVRDLAVKWAWLHVARSVFPLVGAILGFAGILQELGL